MPCVFGYGSLICKPSRERTGNSGNAMPVTVRGLSRGWNIVRPKPEYLLTAVGVVQARNVNCNSVLFKISENDLPRFDDREKGYARCLLQPHQITSLNDQAVP